MNGCSLCGGTERVSVMPHGGSEPQIEDCPRCLAAQLPPTINEHAIGYEIDAAANCLNVSQATIRRLVAAGTLKAFRAGVGDKSPLRFTGRALLDYTTGKQTETKNEPRRRGCRASAAVFPGIND